MKNRWMWRWIGYVVVAAVISLSIQTKASSQSFKDVPPNHRFWEVIQSMQERGLINGYPDGTFRPNEKVSRKHVAQLLDKELQLELKKDTIIRYKDVPTSHPNYDAILSVSQAGIFSGDRNGNFNPDAPLTRIQMAKVLDVAFGLNIESFKHIPDISKNYWGFMHVQALYSNGVTVGDQGYFKPTDSVTRAQYAAFMYRALKVPKFPEGDSNTPLRKEEILNLVYRLPVTIETTINSFKHQGSPFSMVRTELMKNGTTSFIDSDLKNYYANMCMYCDMSLFPALMDETDYRFEILENTSNLVRIRTVSFDAPLGAAGYLEYAFEKQSGKWKLSGYDWDHVGAGSFELSKEEALQIVKNDYERYEASPVRVKLLNTKYENVYDIYTDKDYRRLVYQIQVDIGKSSFDIIFYPHSGLIIEE